MNVDVSDPLAVEAVALDEPERFLMVRHHDAWKILQQFKDQRALGQAPACDLADDEWVRDDEALSEQVGEPRVAPAQVLDPD